MAYREDLTEKDLELCKRVLNAIARPKGEISPKSGFSIADGCLNLVGDVRRSLIDLHPKLLGYSSWGPGYFNWTEDDGSRNHALGWNLYKGKSAERRFTFRLWLPCDLSQPYWSVFLVGSKVAKQKEEYRELKRSLAKNGTVDQGNLVKWVESCAKRWKVI